MTYEQALSDRDYLFDVYGPAADMTGGWVEGEKLQKLLERPTKAAARDILSDLICYWFETGYDKHGDTIHPPDMADPILQEIADRHNPAYIRT